MQKLISTFFRSSPESSASFDTSEKPKPRLHNQGDSKAIVFLGTGGSGKSM